MTPVNDRKNLAIATGGGIIGVLGLALAGSEKMAGTFPQWIEALATLAAFGAALVAASFAAAVFKLEDNRDDRRLEAELREQAERVAAWVVPAPVARAGSIFKINPHLQIRNASDLPVYNVTIVVKTVMEAGGASETSVMRRDLPVLPPTMGELRKVSLDGVQLQLPDTYAKINIREQDEVFKETKQDHYVSIEFRDSGGRSWIRNSDGVLAQIV